LDPVTHSAHSPLKIWARDSHHIVLVCEINTGLDKCKERCNLISVARGGLLRGVCLKDSRCGELGIGF
jgi:hypothetical protein